METRDFYLGKTFLSWKIINLLEYLRKKHDKMLIKKFIFKQFVYYQFRILGQDIQRVS